MGWTRRLLALGALSLGVVIGTASPAVAAENDARSFLTADDTSDEYGNAGVTWTGTPAYGPGHSGVPGDRAFALGAGYLTVADRSEGNFGSGAFTLRFHARFSGRGGPSEQVLSKRATCGDGTFLDVRTRAGRIDVELRDPANPRFAVLHPVNVYDGAYHEVVVTRAASTVSVVVDGLAASDRTVGVVDLDTDAPLRLGDGPCVTGPGRVGDGTSRADVLLDDISYGPGTTPTERPLVRGLPLAAPALFPAPVPTGPEAELPAPAASLDRPRREAADRLPAPASPVSPVLSGHAAVPASPGRVPSAASTSTKEAKERSGPGAVRPAGPANVPEVPASPPASAGADLDPQTGSTPVPAVATAYAAPPAGRAAVDLLAALPDPSDVRADIGSVLSSALLALLLLGVLVLPARAVNRAAAANADRIAAALARLRLPAVAQWYGRLQAPAAVALATAATALGYTLLRPVLGLDASSLALVLGLAAAFTVVTNVAWLSRQVYLGRPPAERGQLRRFPGFLLLALACMLVSRLIGLQSGLVLGALAMTAMTATGPRTDDDGRAKAVSAASMATVGALAWMLREPLVAVVGADGSFGALVAGAALTAVTVSAVVNLAFTMIPVVFLDGAAVLAWSKPRWALFAGLGAFAFVHLLLQPATVAHESFLAGIVAAYLLAVAVFCVSFRARSGDPQTPQVTYS